jgi:hydrogenase expression/formation protein HypE
MNKKIMLNHGSGGSLTKSLIEKLILKYFTSSELSKLNDSALLNISKNRIAFTTDSYVVHPLFFPGGDIGKLSICGTVNDLAVSGAKPLYISISFIIEEGFSLKDFEKILKSISITAKNAGVEIVTGDTKVVEKGKADNIFINSAGIGVVIGKKSLPLLNQIKPGDKIIVSGYLGDHSIAVLSKREGFDFKTSVKSDCACLNNIIENIISNNINIKFIRDITRGGLATILNELSQSINKNISIMEKLLPVRKSVLTICDLLGFSPLYLANEGNLLFIVSEEDEQKLLQTLHSFKETSKAVSIGQVTGNDDNLVVMENIYGIKKVVDMLTGEQLPRIC